MPHRVFGIRHHGPGSALSLRAEFERWQPDCVLIEGPPEADALLPLAAGSDMQPPVALLAYASESPSSAVFYPFAEFSPEWVAIQWALAAQVPVRFIDLPLVHQLNAAKTATEIDAATPLDIADDEAEVDGSAPATTPAPADGPDEEELAWRQLCMLGGFADAESLWDRLVETGRHAEAPASALFAALSAMMGELRQAIVTADARQQRNLQREAYMRQELRRALKSDHQRIAVVCGAWHAPVLEDVSKGSGADAALLKGLSKTKVSVTWVPWTYGRLTRASGYGAGVASPGWYRHLYDHATQGSARWFAEAARVFRRHQLEVSSSHVIEAVRLADALAALRGYAQPALSECIQAIESIYCAGDDTAMRFLANELLIGERMGRVPDSVPDPALAADLKQEQKRLRLKPEAMQRTLDLDLRNETDLARSHLLHRLGILRVHWGQLQEATRRAAKNTFHEIWQITWQPELVVALIEAGRFGNTIAAAAHRALIEASAEATSIAAVAELLQQALHADCTDSVAPLTLRLDTLAAGSNDLPALMQATITLAPVLRYGDVRRTDVSALSVLLAHYAERICVGLPITTSNISDELADALSPQLAQCDQAMRQLQGDSVDIEEDWQRALFAVARSAAAHPLLAGRAVRLLLGRSAIDGVEAGLLLSQALSPGVATAQARWLEGLLADGGLFLLHDQTLLALLDAWLLELPGDAFESVLPVIRRSFSTMSKPERRQIGAAVVGGLASKATMMSADALDWTQAHHIVPHLVRWLGLEEIR